MTTMEVELTDVGKQWLKDHHPQGIVMEYDLDKPFELRSVAADFVEFTYLGVSYRIPHMANNKPTIAKTRVRMPEEILSETAVILPETAVRWAWGLTAKHSEDMEGKIDAEYTQQQMKEIKDKMKNALEARYLDNLYSAVYAAVRNLVIILNGRNHNFSEVEEIIKKQSSMIDNTERLTYELQSIIPRLAAVTVGGTTIPLLVKRFIPQISGDVFNLLIVLASGLAYFLHEWIMIPRTIKKHQRLLIFGEYSRNQYYYQWVQRVRRALRSSLRESINIYESIYPKEYTKNLTEHTKKYVDELTKSLEPTPMCCFVYECMAKTMDDTKKNVIDFDKWGTCESGIGVEKCEEYKARCARS